MILESGDEGSEDLYRHTLIPEVEWVGESWQLHREPGHGNEIRQEQIVWEMDTECRSR